jgi:hypothetical protein
MLALSASRCACVPMLTRAPASGGGARVLRRPVLAAAMQGEHAEDGGPAGPKSSSYKGAETISEPPASRFSFGVSWNKRDSVWDVDLYNPDTKRKEHFGSYASEEDQGARLGGCEVGWDGPSATSHMSSSVSHLSHGETSGDGWRPRGEAGNPGGVPEASSTSLPSDTACSRTSVASAGVRRRAGPGACEEQLWPPEESRSGAEARHW